MWYGCPLTYWFQPDDKHMNDVFFVLAGSKTAYWRRGWLLFWMCGWYWSSLNCVTILFWCNFYSSFSFLVTVRQFFYLLCLDASSPLIFCSWQGWGLTVTLGVPKSKPEVSAHYGLLLSGRTLKGSLFGGWRPKSDIPSLVEKYANKVILKLWSKYFLMLFSVNTVNNIKLSNFIVRTGVVSLSLFIAVVWWWRQVETILVEKSKSQLSID
jgi:hypothetical protein